MEPSPSLYRLFAHVADLPRRTPSVEVIPARRHKGAVDGRYSFSRFRYAVRATSLVNRPLGWLQVSCVVGLRRDPSALNGGRIGLV
jgi:hypothetical protein